MFSSQTSCVLSQDMILEILSWLPVKDLLRFKCVSKGWNQLVSDPAFVKLHLQRSSKNTHMLLTFSDSLSYRTRHFAIVCPIQDLLENPSSTLETLHHKYLPFNRNYNVLGSCNGLVCLQDSSIDDEFEECWFRMGNPATRVMSNESPHIRINRSHYEYPFWLVYGFGYDEWSDTYQVVLLDNNKNKSQKLEVKVCSLGDNCWRNTLTCDAVPFLIGRRLRGICGSFVSGTLNWLAYPKSRAGDDERGGTKMNELEIFSYDLKKEICSYFCMPDEILEVSPVGAALEVLNGCLCLSHYHENDFVVWMKRDFKDEKSWSKLLNCKNYPSSCCCCPRYMDIICMRENDDVVLIADAGFESAFIWCNIRDNRMEGSEIYNDDKFNLSSYDYVHSLVLPYKI
ncbi:F-box/kelch-repeat protein At3g23880-like [Vigna radiata var. radiata]|uniref:F-box/kelch-repeat protein At3g23880-like n=1 Tax=Vigna radiata var. radiata TaxID=3916 RepID=A0A1S3UZG6_VIGRR|nr:F-box/kelch-repeat protein At3g23880-like [Vigna radiata var. radiata]